MASPVLQALLLCDQVYTDRFTGKRILAGVFDKLQSDTFPAKLERSTFAFISIREVQGEVPLALRFHSLEHGTDWIDIGFTLTNHNPLHSVELVIEIPQFPMPFPGKYLFQLLHEDVEFGSIRIEVEDTTQQTSRGDSI
jgi:hypothetical protein